MLIFLAKMDIYTVYTEQYVGKLMKKSAIWLEDKNMIHNVSNASVWEQHNELVLIMSMTAYFCVCYEIRMTI